MTLGTRILDEVHEQRRGREQQWDDRRGDERYMGDRRMDDRRPDGMRDRYNRDMDNRGREGQDRRSDMRYDPNYCIFSSFFLGHNNFFCEQIINTFC